MISKPLQTDMSPSTSISSNIYGGINIDIFLTIGLSTKLRNVGSQSVVAITISWSDRMGADGADGRKLRAARGFVTRKCD